MIFQVTTQKKSKSLTVLYLIMVTYLITGATSKQGKATIKHLLAAGSKIHAVVRDPSKDATVQLKAQAVVLFQGDNENLSVLREAAQGCKRVFICLAPSGPVPGLESRQVHWIVQATKEVGVEVIVASTSMFTADKERYSNEEGSRIIMLPREVSRMRCAARESRRTRYHGRRIFT